MYKLLQLPGFSGLVVGICLLLALASLTWLMTMPKGRVRLRGKLLANHTFEFDVPAEKGSFASLLSTYVDLVKFILGLASGSITLLVGAATFHSTGAGHLLSPFASPLFLLALSILWGVLFMAFIVVNYEAYRHQTKLYTRFKYCRNQAFGGKTMILPWST